MHNNYYFLSCLANELKGALRGFTLVSCFSQNKDELILEFNNASRSFFIKASLQPGFQCLSFPGTMHRAHKNSVDLFNEVLMLPVTDTHSFRNERSFSIRLATDFQLIFKMHGRQANVLLARNDRVISVFRNNIGSDRAIDPNELNRDIDWSYQEFERHQGDIELFYITFGPVMWEYLRREGYDEADLQGRWKLIGDFRRQLEHPKFYITRRNESIQFTLFPIGQVVNTYDTPSVAVTEFFMQYQSSTAFTVRKSSLLATIQGRMKQGRAFLEKHRGRLAAVQADEHYQLWGDLVMANLQRIAPGSKQVELEDFHHPGRNVVIKLKPELSPQRNAEVFYRKSKNRSIELKMLVDSINRKEAELAALQNEVKEVEFAPDLKALNPFLLRYATQEKEKQQQKQAPYHEFEFGGFRILVGKNAQANDELTAHFTYKEDLWLHARDVPGSHVLIKHQDGKNFPKNVIAYAASLAAYYSKRKNESLCPVTVTPVKYVRKRKGDPPGTVVVQREEVVMAVPGKGER